MGTLDSEAKKSRPRKAGGFEFGENFPNVDYGAYVMVRTPATLVMETVTPWVKLAG